MELQPVTSSTIQAIGYDAERSALRVQFVSGGTYEYAGVPADLFERFAASESKGRFFHQEIKPKFVHTKIEEQDAPPEAPQAQTGAGDESAAQRAEG
jgi:hypothetical protein